MAYDLMINANRHLIKGGSYSSGEKVDIMQQLLAAQSPPELERWGSMYPKFFIPPNRDEKRFLQTVIPMSPKTQILSQNSYELEIIRLLHFFAPNNKDVIYIVKETLKRLKKTCFGYKRCNTGECYESGIIVLRFLATAAPNELEWIKRQISVFNGFYFNKKRHSGVLKYFWLCLSELPLEIAQPEVLRYTSIIEQRNKKVSSEDDIIFEHIVNKLLPGSVLI